LSERRQTCGDDECGTAEKIAAVDRVGHEFPDLLCCLRRIDGRFDAFAQLMFFGMKV
jgi:hypothetical protein